MDPNPDTHGSRSRTQKIQSWIWIWNKSSWIHNTAATDGWCSAPPADRRTPVTSRFWHLDSDKLPSAKEIFTAWEWDGAIQWSNSQCSSPLHLVKKKDGSWRSCREFRCLNLTTLGDKYPVPNLANFSSHLEGCTVFSTLDLKNGYLQVPLEKSAVPKTAIISPFSLFEFLRMPFRLKNAGMSFQRFMNRIFNGLGFIFIYINDILMASGYQWGTSASQEPPEVPLKLQGASFIYVHRGDAKPPLTPAYSVPFAVVSRFRKFFILDLGECLESFSVDRLKPHAGPPIFTPATAPRCGRPPLTVAPPQRHLGGGGV